MLKFFHDSDLQSPKCGNLYTKPLSNEGPKPLRCTAYLPYLAERDQPIRHVTYFTDRSAIDAYEWMKYFKETRRICGWDSTTTLMYLQVLILEEDSLAAFAHCDCGDKALALLRDEWFPPHDVHLHLHALRTIKSSDYRDTRSYYRAFLRICDRADHAHL